jgi:hypothetical protein
MMMMKRKKRIKSTLPTLNSRESFTPSYTSWCIEGGVAS